MKKRFCKTAMMAGLISVMLATPAFAIDLAQARSTGAVGEKMDGYVQVLKHSADVDMMAASVNAKRRQEYERISQQNGQPVNVVAKLASVQIINRLPAGALYQLPSGEWKKR